jgi:RiboL-PSP-HEPN
MKNAEIQKQISAIRLLIKRTSEASNGDIEIQAHWAKYVCILVAGLLENAISEIYSDFSSRAASELVANFAGSKLAQIQNPKANLFIEVAKSFKVSWGAELETYIDQDGRKDAINSIMANRHQIAHGKQSGITVARVSAYLNKIEEVLNFIEKQTFG